MSNPVKEEMDWLTSLYNDVWPFEPSTPTGVTQEEAEHLARMYEEEWIVDPGEV